MSHFRSFHRKEISQFFYHMYIKVQFLLVFAGIEMFLNTCMPTFVDSKSGDVTVESVLRRLLKTVVEGTFLNMSIIVFL